MSAFILLIFYPKFTVDLCLQENGFVFALRRLTKLLSDYVDLFTREEGNKTKRIVKVSK